MQGHQGKVSFWQRWCGVNKAGFGEARVEKEGGELGSHPGIAVWVSKLHDTPSVVGEWVWSTVREVKKAMAGRCSDALAPVSPRLSGKSVWRAPSTASRAGLPVT